MLSQGTHGMQRAGTTLLEKFVPLVRALAAEAAVEKTGERFEQVAANLSEVCGQPMPAMNKHMSEWRRNNVHCRLVFPVVGFLRLLRTRLTS